MSAVNSRRASGLANDKGAKISIENGPKGPIVTLTRKVIINNNNQ